MKNLNYKQRDLTSFVDPSKFLIQRDKAIEIRTKHFSRPDLFQTLIQPNYFAVYTKYYTFFHSFPASGSMQEMFKNTKIAILILLQIK